MGFWGWVWWGRSRSQLVKSKQKRPFTHGIMDDVCICTMEPRPRVLGGPNGNLYGDEVLVPVEGSVSFWDHQTPGWNHL